MSRVVMVIMAGAFGLWTAACAARAGEPPEIVVDRSVCSHCGMLISERIYAAALRTPDGAERVFDDIGCLLAAVRASWSAGSADAAVRVWVHDAGDASWIEAPAALFVTSPSLRTPMGGGIVAYRNQSDAVRAAETHGGTVVTSLNELVARTGVSR